MASHIIYMAVWLPSPPAPAPDPHQIVRMLDAARQPDRHIADADAGAQVGRHAPMRRGAGAAGKRLGAAKACK